MKKWIKIIFDPGASTVPVPLVFLSIAIVVTFQLPAYILMRHDYLMPGVLANELISILGVPLLIVFLLGYNSKRLFPFGFPRLRFILVLIVFTAAADVLMDYLTYASELVFPPSDDYIKTLERLIRIDGPMSCVIKLFVLCIVPGICEEIFFRGYIQTSIEAKWGRIVAILIASFLFALLHGNIWYFHLYFLLGLIMGWLYIISGTLVIPIVFHILNNTWTVMGKAYGFELPLNSKMATGDIALIAVASVVVFITGRYLCTRLRLVASRR